DNLWHIGTTFGTAEGGSLPDPAGDQLERTGGDLLTRPGNADDDADTPPPVATFERLPHRPDIADALEAVIGAALGQVDQIRDEIALDFGRVDEMGQPEFSRERLPLRIEIDPDDHVGTDHPATLDHVQPDPAEAEDHDVGARLDPGGIDHGADAGGDAAADVADLVKGRVLADFRYRDLGQ